MITAQDVLSGYGQRKRGKATTSILPYLREQEKQREEMKREMDRKKKGVGAKKPDRDLQDNHADVSETDQYDKARMEILRGDA